MKILARPGQWILPVLMLIAAEAAGKSAGNSCLGYAISVPDGWREQVDSHSPYAVSYFTSSAETGDFRLQVNVEPMTPAATLEDLQRVFGRRYPGTKKVAGEEFGTVRGGMKVFSTFWENAWGPKYGTHYLFLTKGLGYVLSFQSPKKPPESELSEWRKIALTFEPTPRDALCAETNWPKPDFIVPDGQFFEYFQEYTWRAFGLVHDSPWEGLFCEKRECRMEPIIVSVVASIFSPALDILFPPNSRTPQLLFRKGFLPARKGDRKTVIDETKILTVNGLKFSLGKKNYQIGLQTSDGMASHGSVLLTHQDRKTTRLLLGNLPGLEEGEPVFLLWAGLLDADEAPDFLIRYSHNNHSHYGLHLSQADLIDNTLMSLVPSQEEGC